MTSAQITFASCPKTSYNITSQEQTQSFTIKECTSSVSSYWSTADDIFNQSAISYSVLQTPGKNDL